MGEEDRLGEHGYPWAYDRQVPAILWGKGIVHAAIQSGVFIEDVMAEVRTKLNLPKHELIAKMTYCVWKGAQAIRIKQKSENIEAIDGIVKLANASV